MRIRDTRRDELLFLIEAIRQAQLRLVVNLRTAMDLSFEIDRTMARIQELSRLIVPEEGSQGRDDE